MHWNFLAQYSILKEMLADLRIIATTWEKQTHAAESATEDSSWIQEKFAKAKETLKEVKEDAQDKIAEAKEKVTEKLDKAKETLVEVKEDAQEKITEAKEKV